MYSVKFDIQIQISVGSRPLLHCKLPTAIVKAPYVAWKVMSNNNELFTSLISDIKTYNGKDPLFPWIRGIRKMKDTLPPQLLKEKLPRFLQKCTQTFQSDRRYQNDLRYIRVWLQLMDFVDDPRVLLRTMEKNQIGMKSSLFYQAYALYYEKHKKYEEVEKMYHLGVRNHAEPFDELKRSYEQFMGRVRKQKKQRTKCQDGTKNNPLCDGIAPLKTVGNNKSAYRVGARNKAASTDEYPPEMLPEAEAEAEDVCHHGLVDPTINMKEAINDINRMFCEPLDTTLVGRRMHRRQPEDDIKNAFKVFIDEDLENGTKLDNHGKRNPSLLQQNRSETRMPPQEPLCIFVDEENDETTDRNYEKDEFECSEIHNSKERSSSTVSHENVFVFPFPKDNPSENSDGLNVDPRRSGFREDTVVCRFVGSTISDEQKEVENVCHHGLVDPTINLKEAMDDINNMFGKPIDFVRAKGSNKPEREPEMNKDFGGFVILPDDDLQHQEIKPMPKSSGKPRGCDLFEPTLVTKEAIDDINKMFGMPLDF